MSDSVKVTGGREWNFSYGEEYDHDFNVEGPLLGFHESFKVCEKLGTIAIEDLRNLIYSAKDMHAEYAEINCPLSMQFGYDLDKFEEKYHVLLTEGESGGK